MNSDPTPIPEPDTEPSPIPDPEPTPNSEGNEEIPMPGEKRSGLPPSPEAEAAADRSLSSVDLEEVGENYREMTQLGADVKGEGQIDPEDDKP